MMKRNMKKAIASILCLSLAIGTTSFAQEGNVKLNENVNPYVQGITEEVKIEGTTYSYEYDMEDGNKVTHITNEDTSETDDLIYDEENGVFYLNGEVVAEVEDVETVEDNIANTGARASNYKYIGSVNKKITWKKAVAAGVLAAIIATAIGHFMSAAAVITAAGLSALSVASAAAANGVVKAKVYRMKAGRVTTYKYVWSFTPSGGKKLGNHTSYMTV